MTRAWRPEGVCRVGMELRPPGSLQGNRDIQEDGRVQKDDK